MASEILTSLRMQPVIVANPGEALVALRQAADRKSPYRVLLLDADLDTPLEVFLVESSARADLASTPMVLLTANGRPGQRERLATLPELPCISKPLRPSDVCDAVVTALALDVERIGADHSHAADKQQHRIGRSLKILLAEDNLVNQRLAVLLLEKHGHKVSVVGDGEKAWRAATTERFDVVLMDVQMPIMDGLNAVRKIRVHEAKHGGHVPVVAMTAHAMKGDRERCLEAGMDGYVTKPIRPQDLYDAIAKVVTNPVPDATNVDSASQHEATVGPRSLPAAAIDWNQALVHTGGDEALMRTIIEVFLEEYPGMLDELKSAMDAEDFSRLKRAAHTLKGSCGYFAAKEAFEIALALEKCGENSDTTGVDTLYEHLNDALHRMLPDLHAFLRAAPASA
jgi:CheY-like chemotaxis protein/HPt (histidine-containing phosphotransfer) domain-containing protein